MTEGGKGTQVPKEHYYRRRYDNVMRFVSYHYQTDIARSLKPSTLLEIGVGNKTVSNYLRQQGLSVTTCDFDASLEPDVVADVRKLPFEDGSFDAVLAYEILEHVPWKDVGPALAEIHRVSRRHAVVSLPYSAATFELLLRLPFIGRVAGRPYLEWCVRVPNLMSRHEFDGEHHWEMGRREFPVGRIRDELRKKFKIVREVRPVLDTYHHFFVLEKR